MGLLDRFRKWRRGRSAPEPVAGEGIGRDFQLTTPAAAGPLHVKATLDYRKIDQFLLNFVFGEDNGRDRAIDFGFGHDVIDVSAIGAESLHDLDISFGWFTTKIRHDEGSLTLYGWHSLEEEDFIFA